MVKKKIWKRNLSIILLVGIIGGLIWFGYVQWKILSVNEYGVSEPVDVAIILGASLRNDYPSPALKERLDHAVQLYQQRMFTKIIVTGGMDFNGSTITEAEGMKRYLVSQGIPDDIVLTEDKARSTYENLLFSQKIMKQEDLKNAVIVSHVYHGARALEIARFLEYQDPQVDLTRSEVMFMPWHKFRETLAYTKWILQKTLITAR